MGNEGCKNSFIMEPTLSWSPKAQVKAAADGKMTDVACSEGDDDAGDDDDDDDDDDDAGGDLICDTGENIEFVILPSTNNYPL